MPRFNAILCNVWAIKVKSYSAEALSQLSLTCCPHTVQVMPSFNSIGFLEAQPPLTSAFFTKNKRMANSAKPMPNTANANNMVAIVQK
jgi:hypothetical protein